MTRRSRRAVAAFAAADPARVAAPMGPAERDLMLRAIHAMPPVAASPQRRGRTRTSFVAVGIATLVLVAAGGVAATTGGLPVGDDSVVNTPPAAQREVRGASGQVPVAPGQRDPGVGPLEGNYAQGAAASQLVFRRMCTWDRRLLEAIAAGDAAMIASTKAELAHPRWYQYFAPSSADDMRRLHAEAGPGHTTPLQQLYDVNCRDVTG